MQEKAARKSRQGEERSGPDLPFGKKLVFAMLTVGLFFGGLELVLALLGVEPVLYHEDPYVGFAGTVSHFVEEKQAEGTRVVRTAENKLRLFHPQSFAVPKPEGTYRIFCLGGSTTYGRPFGDATSFCGWLRELLPVADPGHRWELINLGGISYASYRVALLAEELLAYEPDLFLIYTGHNEFLEQRTYGELREVPGAVRGLAAVAARTRIFTVGRSLLARVRGMGSPEAGGERRTEATEAGMAVTLEPELRTRLDGSIGPDAYERDDELRGRVLDHFRHSLVRLVDIARSVDAEAVLTVPASNLRDCTPFKSQPSPGVDEIGLRRVRGLLAAAVDVSSASDAQTTRERAVELVEEAASLDPRSADVRFAQGRVLDRVGRYAEARRAYEDARDEDVCPLRALGETIEIVRAVAENRDVPLVDFAARVDERARDGIPGRDQFLDHVHPTIEENRNLALAYLEVLIAEGIVEPVADWGPAAVAEVTREVEAGIDPVQQGIALSNLSRVLGWAGKLEEADRLARRSVELAPDVGAVHHQAALSAHLSGDLERAEQHYRRTIELEPGNPTAHSNLAVILDEAGRDRLAAFHYRKAISLLGDRNAEYRERLRQALKAIED